MDRRELLGVLGATAAGLVAVGGGQAIAREKADDDIHEKCADACSDCEKECDQAFHHCYKELASGKTGHAKAMRICVDCGDVCSTAGKLVARMSPLMVHTCAACAECCDVCIAECEKLGDPVMKEVIGSCKKCAASCREMVKAMGGRARTR